jgi:hypothetical protein
LLLLLLLLVLLLSFFVHLSDFVVICIRVAFLIGPWLFSPACKSKENWTEFNYYYCYVTFRWRRIIRFYFHLLQRPHHMASILLSFFIPFSLLLSRCMTW